MAAQAFISIGDFVSVNVYVEPIAVPYSLFGIPLAISDEGVIDVDERVRTYSDLIGVGNDFGSSGAVYGAATVFFDQSPTPSVFMAGRWASTATNGILEGAILTPTQQLIANFNAVTSGGMFLMIDGIPHSISGIQLGSLYVSNLNAAASQLQAQLPAGVTCQWHANEDRFSIKSSTTGVTSSLSYAQAPTDSGYWAYSGVGSIADTITIGTQTVTYIANGGTPTTTQIALGTTQLETMAATLAFLTSSALAQVLLCTYVSDGVSKIYAISNATGVQTIAIAATSTAITASGADLAGATGTDISSLFGFTSAAGADVIAGIAAETPLDAVMACANVSNVWYGVSFPQNTSVQLSIADHVAIGAFILGESRARMYGISIYGNAPGGTEILDPLQTSDLASSIQSQNNKRMVMMYSSYNPASVFTMFGRAFTTNWNAANTAYCLAYKQAPGIPGEALTEQQFKTLQSKGGNVNIAIATAGTPVSQIWPGWMSQGYWFDEVHGVDWWANRIQVDLFNFQRSLATKVPQTDAGSNMLAGVINGSNAAAVNNGLLAPGLWTAEQIMSLLPGMTLTAGYLTQYPPVATQSPTNRSLRVSVPFQVAGKLAGAVQIVDVSVNVNR